MDPPQLQAEIAQQIADLHEHWYRVGPSSARAYHAGDVIVVVLEGTFTPAEQELIRHEEAGSIQTTRRRFESVMAEDFVGIIEQATGRKVRAFTSDTDLQENLAVETFVLGGPREDMTGFES